MPYKSLAQLRWAHTPSGLKALGKATVEEYARATKGKKLPEKASTRLAKRLASRHP